MMTYQEQEILDLCAQRDRVVIEQEISVLSSLLDAYMKTANMIEYCESAVVFEQYSIIQEAEKVQGTPALWDDKASALENIALLIPKLVAAIISLIAQALSGSNEVTEVVSSSAQITEEINKPENKDEAALFSEVDEEAIAEAKKDGATWGKVLGITGGALTGIGLLAHLTGLDKRVVDYAEDKIMAYYTVNTGMYKMKYNFERISEALVTINEYATELSEDVNECIRDKQITAFRVSKIRKGNLDNIFTAGYCRTADFVDYPRSRVEEELKNFSKSLKETSNILKKINKNFRTDEKSLRSTLAPSEAEKIMFGRQSVLEKVKDTITNKDTEGKTAKQISKLRDIEHKYFDNPDDVGQIVRVLSEREFTDDNNTFGELRKKANDAFELRKEYSGINVAPGRIQKDIDRLDKKSAKNESNIEKNSKKIADLQADIEQKKTEVEQLKNKLAATGTDSQYNSKRADIKKQIEKLNSSIRSDEAKLEKLRGAKDDKLQATKFSLSDQKGSAMSEKAAAEDKKNNASSKQSDTAYANLKKDIQDMRKKLEGKASNTATRNNSRDIEARKASGEIKDLAAYVRKLERAVSEYTSLWTEIERETKRSTNISKDLVKGAKKTKWKAFKTMLSTKKTTRSLTKTAQFVDKTLESVAGNVEKTVGYLGGTVGTARDAAANIGSTVKNAFSRR